VNAELIEQHDKLQLHISELQENVREIMEPALAELLKRVKNNNGQRDLLAPHPIASWDFSVGVRDELGAAHGTLHGETHIANGALVTNGNNDYLLTAPLNHSLQAKTLEAWVRLDNLDQRGAGVMTVQTLDGAVFDAIIFGEKDPRQWLAGSNSFMRTRSFSAPAESEATLRPVHIAIVYHEDGRIEGYRDGQPYGKAYQSTGPQEFKAGETIVGFGVRHLPPGGNRMLAGQIVRARLYDRALSQEEVAASSGNNPNFVPQSQILATLSQTDRKTIATARSKIQELEQTIDALGPVGRNDEQAIWIDWAKAMFSFKEFIYLK